MGDPRTDRQSLHEYFTKYPKVSTSQQVLILVDNFTFQRRIMVEHLAFCTTAGKACDPVLTQFELGEIFYGRIEWTSSQLGGLNAILYEKIAEGFLEIGIAAKLWCERNISLEPATSSSEPSAFNLKMPSSSYSSSELEHGPSRSAYYSSSFSPHRDNYPRPLPCFNWDGRQCSRLAEGRMCNFEHPPNKDTRQAPPTYRNRSRSRSREPSYDRNRDYRRQEKDPRNRDRDYRGREDSRNRDRDPRDRERLSRTKQGLSQP